VNPSYVPKAPQGAARRIFQCVGCERGYDVFILAQTCQCAHKVQQRKECPTCKCWWPLDVERCCGEVLK
jgi:hypothetical protein